MTTLPRMSLPRSGAAAALVAALGLSLAAVPAQAKTIKCEKAYSFQKNSDKFGPSYVTSLHVTNTTCKRGEEVIRAYQKCRHQHGGRKGRCPTSARPEGYRCTATQSRNANELTGKATCRKGTVRIVHTYTEFI